MKSLITLFVLLFSQFFWAQEQNFGIEYTPGGQLDYVFDHFGNQYSFEEIAIPNRSENARTIYPTCTSGYFELHFTAGSGMLDGEHPNAAERRAVLCRVFFDISQMIQSPLTTNGTRVQIWVRAINSLPNFSANLLGVASGFYNVAQTTTTNPGGIVDNEIWKTINSGINSYTNVVSPIVSSSDASGTGGLFYHGMVAINPNVNWHTNLTTLASSSNQDLYTVTLHEVAHALGFASLINNNGQSKLGANFNYYNRYDLQLRNAAGVPLLTNSGACSTMYNYTFTGNVASLDPGSCANTVQGDQPTDCATTIGFGQNLIPVYRPACYQSGSSLSHFEDACFTNTINLPNGNNNYFVMSNATANGTNKRFLRPEERQVLCEIGYSLSNTFGNNSSVANSYYLYLQGNCNNGQIAGINDGLQGNTYSFTGNVNTAISLPNLLLNDFGAAGYECLEVISGTGTITNPSGTNTTVPTYTPTQGGLHLLRYIPVDGNKRGNITYVYVYAEVSGIFFECSNSNVCNIVNNGGFEINSHCGQINSNSYPGNASCWNGLGTADFFSTNCNYPLFNFHSPGPNTNSSYYTGAPSPPYAQNNNFFAGFQSYERLLNSLNAPLINGETYILSFWCRAFTINNNQNFTQSIEFGSLEFFGSFSQNAIILATQDIPTNNQWYFFSIPFTFNNTTNHNALYIKNNALVSLQSIYVDDVSIIPVSQLTSIILPPNLCAGQTLTNLDNYLAPAPPGGIFSGNGVNGTSFTPTTPGVYTINYTYNNNNGCEVVITTTFEVLNCANDITPLFPTYGPYCVGATPAVLPTVSSNGVNGVWSPATINTAVAGTFDFTFTPTITNPSQNAQTITVQITINEPVVPTFNFSSTILCQGNTFTLPNASTNDPAIFGHWELVSNPGITVTSINAAAVGNFEYIFIPNNSCNENVSYTFTVENCSPIIIIGNEVSCEITNPSDEEYDPEIDINFPGDDNINNGPCLRVCENSIIEYYLTGNTSLISSTVWNITGGTLISYDDIHCEILWNGAVVSHIQAVVTLNTISQNTLTIDRCVEQIAQPHAEFNILPFNVGETVTICSNTNITFNNLSTANDGNGELYYLWDFGDGSSSTEFEPTHSYTEINSYLVTLTVTNGCSCIATYETEIKINEGIRSIECPSVVCEGQIATYSVDADCDVEFEIYGGNYLGQNGNEVTVNWNNVDESGFGTISTSAGCFDCTMVTQIPVIQNNGQIQGLSTICQGEQAIYNLPQWPTTDFNWSLNDNGTGATLIYNNQRNEIIIQSNEPGSISLSCQYFNTLLGCSGFANYEINVNPSVHIAPVDFVCIGNSQNFQFLDNNNYSVNVNYVIYEPNNPSPIQNGTNVNNFNLTPTVTGYYTVEITNSNLCGQLPMEIKVIDGLNPAPTINGEQLVCPNTPYTYSASSSNDSNVTNATLHWSVNGGVFIGPSTGSSVQILFNATATPPYTVSAYYEQNSCVSITSNFEVNPKTIAIEFDNPVTEVCGSAIQNYSISSLPTSNIAIADLDFINWSLQPANAGSIENGNTPFATITWNNNATAANLNVTVRSCGIEEIISVPITINNTVPVTLITTNSIVCAESSVQFTLLGLTSYSSIDWDFGDGPLQTINGITPFNFSTSHAFDNIANTTSFTITATIYQPNGCLNPAVVSIPVTVVPTPVVQLDKAPFLNLCNSNNQPADFVFTVPTQAGWAGTASIEWFHNGTPTGITTPSITIPNPNASGSTVTAADVIGNYVAYVTNEVNVNGTIVNCTGQSQQIIVKNQCPVGVNCTNYNSITYSSTIGCNTVTYNANPNNNPDQVIFSLSNGEQFIDNTAPFTATFSNLSPGEYVIDMNASINSANGNCWFPEFDTFIIPYQADLKFDVVCNNGAYDVTLLDYSRFYNSTPIDYYEFTIGTTTQTITSPVSLPAINQATFAGLAPGTYNFTILISRAGYAPCTFTLQSIVLPEIMPVTGFTITDINGTPLTAICEGEPVYLTPVDNNGNPVVCADCSFNWNFLLDGATNTSQNMVKTFQFSNGDFQPISLTVTNKWGCSEPFSNTIQVYEIGIKGKLEPSNLTACMGDTVTLSYVTTTGTQNPFNLQWFYNSVNNPIGYGVTMDITQPGYYFAYGYTAEECREVVEIDPINVSFIPLTAPVISGTSSFCRGSAVVLTVPSAANTTYTWQVSTNGGTSFTTIPGNTSITYMPPNAGSYIFSVVATSGGCSSNANTHTVLVNNTPNTPNLQITNVQCEPYSVTVSVSNPQTDVVYNWSNGTMGTSTVSYHDGPLQVRAELLGCSASNQIDLPLDVNSHKWLFPNGCFDFCITDFSNEYIIGPNEAFNHWVWHTPDDEISGTGYVSDLIVENGAYQQFISTDYCSTTFGTANINYTEHCELCEVNIDVINLYCDVINNQTVYFVELHIDNTSGNFLNTILTAPNGEGYFSPSTFSLNGGSYIYTGYFIPTNSFNGGFVNILLQGTDGLEFNCFNSENNLNFDPCDIPKLAAPKDKIALAPNPTSQSTTIYYELVSKGEVQLLVTDAMGRELYTIKKPENKGSIAIDVSQWSKGYYVIKLMKNGTTVFSEKLIKN